MDDGGLSRMDLEMNIYIICPECRNTPTNRNMRDKFCTRLMSFYDLIPPV